MPDARSPIPMILLVPHDASGWEMLRPAAETLEEFGLRWERVEPTPESKATEVSSRGWRAVIVAAPDGTLPGRYARATGLPTVRVPVEGNGRTGLELLRDDTGQLPAGPEGGSFATMAIGAAGARNAALFLVAVLALEDSGLREKWREFRERQTAAVLEGPALGMKDEG